MLVFRAGLSFEMLMFCSLSESYESELESDSAEEEELELEELMSAACAGSAVSSSSSSDRQKALGCLGGCGEGCCCSVSLSEEDEMEKMTVGLRGDGLCLTGVDSGGGFVATGRAWRLSFLRV